MGFEDVFRDGDKAQRLKVRTGQYGKKALIAAQGATGCFTGLRKDVGNVGDAVCGDTSLVATTVYDTPIRDCQAPALRGRRRHKSRPDEGRRDAHSKGLRQSRSAHPTQRTHHDATRTAHKAHQPLANVSLQSIQFCAPAPRLPAFVAKRPHFFFGGAPFGLIRSLPMKDPKADFGLSWTWSTPPRQPTSASAARNPFGRRAKNLRHRAVSTVAGVRQPPCPGYAEDLP